MTRKKVEIERLWKDQFRLTVVEVVLVDVDVVLVELSGDVLVEVVDPVVVLVDVVDVEVVLVDVVDVDVLVISVVVVGGPVHTPFLHLSSLEHSLPHSPQ